MKSRNPRLFLRQFAPWIIAAIILVILFGQVDFKQFLDALRLADIRLYLPLLIVFIAICFFIDSHNLTLLLRQFGHQNTHKETLKLVGENYLLSLLNYYIGAGGMAYCLLRDKNIPISRGASLMLFYIAVTQISLFSLAAIGFLFISRPSSLLKYIFLISICVLAMIIIGLILLKFLPSKGFLLRIKNISFLRVFIEAGFKKYVLLIFWRMLYYSTFIVFFWGAVKAFHMNIPFEILASYVPIILLLIGIPITPFGLGTVQGAMIIFFNDYGNTANILAFGIVYSTSIALVRAAIGLFYTGNRKNRRR